MTISPEIGLPELRTFYEVNGNDPQKMEVITDIFNRVLVPLYGPQEKAIEQIYKSSDRKAFLLYQGPCPVAVLVFKTVLSQEYADLGITDSIEVKSLFVDQSAQYSGKGFGSNLITKLFTEVAKLNLGHKGLHVTVSESKTDSLAFFQKKGFTICHKWQDRYQQDTVEYLLSCPLEIASIDQAA